MFLSQLPDMAPQRKRKPYLPGNIFALSKVHLDQEYTWVLGTDLKSGSKITPGENYQVDTITEFQL